MGGLNATSWTNERAEDLIRGLSLLATGGGGHPAKGRAHLRPHIEAGESIDWISVDDLPGDAWVCCTLAMGSSAPASAMTADERRRLGYGDITVPHPMPEAVRMLMTATKRPIAALVPFELGAFNTIGPIDAALRLGVKIVDADLCGRAVPELSQTTAAIAGLALCPMTICDSWGNRLIFEATHSVQLAERIGKMVSIVTRSPDPMLTCAHAGYLMAVRDLRKVAIRGTVSLALRVGERIRTARERAHDPIATIAHELDGWVVFEGTVARREWESRDGYMIGTTVLTGSRTCANHQMRLWFKNENHIAWLDERPWVMSPDLIMIVDRQSGEPFTNTDLSDGHDVAVLVASAPELLRTPAALAVLSPSHYGFDVPYVSAERILGPKGFVQIGGR